MQKGAQYESVLSALINRIAFGQTWAKQDTSDLPNCALKLSSERREKGFTGEPENSEKPTFEARIFNPFFNPFTRNLAHFSPFRPF
jgi:hypothetical protein